MVSIKGLDKAKVLKALYDNSHVQGMGFMHAVPEGVVTVRRCRELLEMNTYYECLFGRVLKVDLSGDEFDERLYDRDCGEGAAQRAVDSVAREDAETKPEDGQKDGGIEKGKTEHTVQALVKVLEILAELQPDECYAAAMYLKHFVLGPFTIARIPTPPSESMPGRYWPGSFF